MIFLLHEKIVRQSSPRHQLSPGKPSKKTYSVTTQGADARDHMQGLKRVAPVLLTKLMAGKGYIEGG
ncbi:hypothetical protein SR38_00645 [Atlantibacter hermannii]|nr:hypothetical protein SR38_00645 [Atlantibacter hermannii]